MRLCRFFVLFGDVYCPDAIVDNTDSLYPPAIDLFGFEDQNFLHEFPDDLCVQFLNVRVPALMAFCRASDRSFSSSAARSVS